MIINEIYTSLCSAGIRSVVDEMNVGKTSSGLTDDPMCSVCEMAVVWMQNRLRQNETQERILNYVNEVKQHFLMRPVFFG